MGEYSSKIPLQLMCFFDSDAAIKQQNYREAIEVLMKGLDEAARSADQLKALDVINCCFLVISSIEESLKQIYGEEWEEQIEKPAIPEAPEIRCSFCGKAQSEIKKVIAGPSVYICNECVDICNEILSPDKKPEEKQLRCSFCDKDQSDVKKLIAGPNAYICNECIEVSHEIISDTEKV